MHTHSYSTHTLRYMCGDVKVYNIHVCGISHFTHVQRAIHSSVLCSGHMLQLPWCHHKSHEYDYKGNLASTAVILYYNGVGYSLSIIILLIIVYTRVTNMQ